MGPLACAPILVPVAVFERGPEGSDQSSSGCHRVRRQPVLIGRDPSADIWLPDHRVSWHHASFERSGPRSEYIVFDAGSRNGVTVDRLRLPAWTARRVMSFAVIGFGPLEFVFVDGQDALGWLAAIE